MRGISISRRAMLALVLSVPAVAHAEEQNDPTAPIRALYDGLLQLMQAGPSQSFADRMRFLTPLVQRAFDLTAVLRDSIGLRWNAMPAAQQAELLDVFTQYTVASYVANFDTYDGERLEVSPQTRAINSERVVATAIVPTSGDPTRIDYVMHQDGSGWQAIDVLLDGSISRVAVQRSDFRALLASGDPAKLIESLRSKVAAYAAGARF